VRERSHDSDATRRLADLRRSQANDPTLKNLLAVLTAKLELSSRLPVCEWEAAHQDDASCADMFRRLAEDERRSCSYLLDCLHKYLERQEALTGGSQL
jgi:hypothetical protein